MESMNSAFKALFPCLEAFSAANNGKKPTHISELQPFLRTATQQEAFQQLLHDGVSNININLK